MKTAISIPDDVFAEIEVIVKSRGVTRSYVYVTALREFLERQREEQITAQINTVLAKEKNDLDPAWRRAQTRSLLKATEGDEW